MFYDIAFIAFSVIYLPTLLFRGRLHRAFFQRFGDFDTLTISKLKAGPSPIWIQAVSVGEVALCRIFVSALKKKNPEIPIVISTITKTGYDLAIRSFAQDATVIYFPLDLSWIVNKVVGLIRPRLYIMVETEIWPNVLKEMAKRNVPAILINGRISDSSFGTYMKWRFLLRETLSRISLFSMRSQVDADRIISMGASPSHVIVSGNMKFDIVASTGSLSEARQSFAIAEDDCLFVCGSTHDGEEELLLKVFKQLATPYPHLRILLAPRHVDRVGEIEALIIRMGLRSIRVSSLASGVNPDRDRKILILDTIGRLNDAYQAATLVFVGGSLIKHGGQNPIEPAVLGRPIIFGPHMFNFTDVVRLFLESSAALQVSDENELYRACMNLLKDSDMRSRLGKAAKDVVSQQSGALARTLKAMEGLY